MKLKYAMIKSNQFFRSNHLHRRRDLERWLGSVIYYSRFVKNLAMILQPLYELKSENRFNWLSKHQQAFEKMKQILTSTPVLIFSNFNKPFQIETDTSGTGLGSVLKQDGKCVLYTSRTL